MPKPKVAIYWCASCGGCEEAVVDLAERILDLVGLVDIVFWPVALDFKLSDVEAMPDRSIDIAMINGGVRTTENEKVAKLLREKSELVVAYGACSAKGGVPGMANFSGADEILEWVYKDAPTTANEAGVRPSATVQKEARLELPAMLPMLKPLDDVIDVDYYVPGCPPTPDVTWNALSALIAGKRPKKGSVVGADDRALCHTCPLNETKPKEVAVKSFRRITEFSPDRAKCLLVQGLPCLGPVTRGGCTALCVRGGMPCTGCFGPVRGGYDFGGKVVTYLASILDLDDEADIEEELSKLVDIGGLSNRYSLPASLIQRAVPKEKNAA